MADSRKLRSTDTIQAVVSGCLDRYVSPGQSVALGLSGGVDSVVLLHALSELKTNVSAVHVHHGLNPAADDWAAFCEELCVRWKVPFRIERVDVERNSDDGLEAAARRARHGALDNAAGDWIMLAHHEGDRAETMLFNILRGAGIRGAGALREINGRLLRPLVSVSRSRIQEYAHDHALPWVDDVSNADIRFTRNYLRHRVIPELESRFPAASMMMARAAGHFAEAADMLDELARVDLGGGECRFPVHIDMLVALSEPRARNALRFLLSQTGVGIPSEDRLIEAVRQCTSAAPDRHPAIVFGGYTLSRRGGYIYLAPK